MNEHTPRAFRILAIVLPLSGATSLAVSWKFSAPPLSTAFFLLLVAALVAESAAILLPKGFSASLSFPLSLAASLLLGPSAGGAIALFTGISISDIRDRIGAYVLAYNAGQVVLTVVASGWLYLFLGGRTLWLGNHGFVPLQQHEFPQILIPLIVLGASATVLNAALTGVGVALKYGTLGTWKQHLSALAVVQFSLAIVAVSIAQVMSVQLIGFVLFVFPLFVARQVYQRYVTLRQSYIDTVRSLVAALEAKDRYTAGHSERVAAYSVAIAQAMGLSADAVERIDLAAQLHDLGKVGIPNEVLSKPGRLTSVEFDAIRAHPDVGADIVAGVPGLAHIVPIVRYHHERYDGNGYCAGLAGEEIPLEARIMTVADAFDAMTSSRAYRAAMSLEAAIDEVRECAGSQFDPEVVEHFLRSAAYKAGGDSQ